ncbi:hypothetical protein [Piscinibacter sp.]|uniref:hypothetical protein n=1 Tax=Piscinibacter sp. TaxID=1903157 RepID=UPI0011DC7136|nr:MAG: hypothetical protein E6Q93_09920 [Burkholderiaceae bacterium]
MHAYQEQESQQTLAQALQEYHAVHPGLSQARHMNPKAAFFFRCHDTVHVVFGCGVELDDEAVVKIASILGTTAGLSVLKGYVLQESLDIYWQLRVVDVLRAIGHAVVIVPRTVIRCLSQRGRWPWSDHEQYLDVSLQAIRQQSGIKVVHQAHRRGR